MSKLSIPLFLSILALATQAAALDMEDCDDVPSPGTGEDCLVYYNLANHLVCHHSAANSRYECADFGTEADVVFAVSDDSDGILVWGTSHGHGFCCPYATNEPIYIDTSGGDDYVELHLETDYWTNWFNETSEIWTGNGNDQVVGSDYDDCSYPCDDIYVGYGEDLVYAFSGDDHVNAPIDDGDSNEFHGDAGNDLLEGGGDDDYLYGNEGVDIIYCRDGDDQAWGGSGGDWIGGGDGRDTISGELGNDLLCGDGDIDSINGGKFGYDDCADTSDATSGCENVDDSCPALPW